MSPTHRRSQCSAPVELSESEEEGARDKGRGDKARERESWRAGTEATHSPGGGCNHSGPGFVNDTPPQPLPEALRLSLLANLGAY